MPTKTCTQGTCNFTADEDQMAMHMQAAHPAPLGGSSPTSWPPGSLDPANVEPVRIVATHPDGSVAETLPVTPAPDAGAPEGAPAPPPAARAPKKQR
jgi:hypothetical protein